MNKERDKIVDLAAERVRRILEDTVSGDELAWCEDSLAALDIVNEGIKMRHDELKQEQDDS